MKEFVKLRTQSIRKQLNGELSTISSEQSEKDKVDASQLNLVDMGGSFSKANTDSN